MIKCIIFYCLPFLPFISRGVLIFSFRKKMKMCIGKKAMDRETHRTVILSMAGFSFSALLALVVVDSSSSQDFYISIYYLFISFLGYLVALNIQSYKAKWWQDYLGNAFMDTASLSLILAVLGILLTHNFSRSFGIALAIVAISVWLVDHLLRVIVDVKYFKDLKEEE